MENRLNKAATRHIAGMGLTMAIMAMVTIPATAAKAELDRYLEQTRGRGEAPVTSPGSLFAGNGPYADLARDLRSHQVDDLVMIIVSDRASAVAKGATTSSRKADSSAGITGLLGTPPVAARLANLAGLKSDRSLQGQGETSRETTLSTTISARVIEVLIVLVSVHGAPRYLRSDNGPEFIATALLAWLAMGAIDTAFIAPGKP